MAAAVEQVDRRPGCVGAPGQQRRLLAVRRGRDAATSRASAAQFETNVFGLLRMSSAGASRRCASGVRAGSSTSASMGGRLTFPGGGVYHATKYAVEALSDAMRFEVAGIRRQGRAHRARASSRPTSTTTAVASVDTSHDDGPTPSSTAWSRRRPTERLHGSDRHSSAAGRRRVARRSIEKALTAGAPEGPLHGHAVGEAGAHPTRGDARPALGPLDALAVPRPRPLIQGRLGASVWRARSRVSNQTVPTCQSTTRRTKAAHQADIVCAIASWGSRNNAHVDPITSALRTSKAVR